MEVSVPFKPHHRLPWLVWATAGLAFSLYAWAGYSVGANPPFSSPDETANRFFTEQVQRTGIPDAPADGSDLVRPRSVGVLGERYVPQSFLGLPVIFGYQGRIIGLERVWLVTPLLAALGAVAVVQLVRPIFGPRVAYGSMLLLLFHPVYMYYATHAYWHNGPFLSLLLISAAVLYRFRTGEWWAMLVAGCTLGAAIAIRSNEFLWIGAFLTIVAWYNRTRLHRSHLLVPVGMIAMLVPIALLQARVFGNAIAGAYTPGLGSTGEGSIATVIDTVYRAILPFGFDPGSAFTTFVRYSASLLFGAFTIGLLWSLNVFARGTRQQRMYVVSFLGIGAWLVLYYGSFGFVEFLPDPSAVLLGDSHFRYWLPVYVLAVPLTSAFLLHAGTMGFLGSVLSRGGLLMILLAGILRFTAEPHAGIVAQWNDRNTAISLRDAVSRRTPGHSLVLAGTFDKVVWPHRAVVGYDLVPLPDAVVRTIPDLLRTRPVYFIPQVPGDTERVAEILRASNIRIETVGTLPSQRALIQFHSTP